jgi:hypothetical protein
VLPLDSNAWTDLAHAYGRAGDIPALLRRLADEPDQAQGAWAKLWASLCHQGTPYPAAYAALPHIIAIVGSLPATSRIEHLRFAGAIAMAEAEVPPGLDADYRRALARALPMVEDGLGAHPTVDDAAWLLWIGLALRGLQEAARALEPFADGCTFQTRCPADLCGVGLWLDRDGEGWAPLVMEENSKGPSTTIAPPDQRAPGEDWTAQAAPARMAALAEHHGYPTLAAKLDLLMGTAQCPSCHQQFQLWPEILAPSDL